MIAPRNQRPLATALALLALFASACAGSGGAFSTRYPDNQADDAAELMARLDQAPRRTRPGIAVGVTASPVGLYAFDINTQRILWQQAASLSGTPIIAGDQVVVQDGDRVVGRELRTGALLFSVGAQGMSLVGADGEGRASVLGLSKGQGTFARSRVVLTEGRSVAWDAPLSYQVGAPALMGNTVLVPWGNQYLSGLDRASGDEIARVRVADGVMSQAFVAEGGAYAGSEEGAAHVSQALATGSLKAGKYIPAPEEELPGRPSFLRNVYRRDEILGPTSARHSIALTWTPASDGVRLGLADGMLYLVFYRFVFALEYPSLDLRWVHTHEADIIGAQAERGGILVADRNGAFALLSSASGAMRGLGSTSRDTTSAVLPEGMAFPQTGAEEVDEDVVRRQLLLASQDPDTRLVPVRRLAVQLLAGLSSAEATRDLLTLCEGEKSAPAVRREACDALAKRKAGASDVLGALTRHYDYLKDQSTPPIAALARAAAQQGSQKAIPELVAHLRDPHTPARALKALINALFELDEHAAVAPVGEFVRLYHADGRSEHLVQALTEGIVRLSTEGSPEALSVLQDLAADPLGLRAVQEKADAMLAEHEKSARMKAQQAEAATDAEAGEEVEEPEPAGPPPRLTLALVEKTLRPVRSKLKSCLSKNGRNDFHVRVILVVEDDELQLVSVLPKEQQACVEPLIRSQAFPKTLNAARQQLIYTFDRK